MSSKPDSKSNILYWVHKRINPERIIVRKEKQSTIIEPFNSMNIAPLAHCCFFVALNEPCVFIIDTRTGNSGVETLR